MTLIPPVLLNNKVRHVLKYIIVSFRNRHLKFISSNEFLDISLLLLSRRSAISKLENFVFLIKNCFLYEATKSLHKG